MPAYVRQFGQLVNGKYVLSASRVSFISSIAYVGKCETTWTSLRACIDVSQSLDASSPAQQWVALAIAM